jgi:hypothetical protein
MAEGKLGDGKQVTSTVWGKANVGGRENGEEMVFAGPDGALGLVCPVIWGGGVHWNWMGGECG